MGLKYYYSKEFQQAKNVSLLTMPIYSNEKKYQSTSEIYTSLGDYHGNHYPIRTNIYANIGKLTSDLSNETSYATLVNTTSINAPIIDENNNTNHHRVYENLQSNSMNNTSPSASSSSSPPIYINLNDQNDEPPVLPPSLRKADHEEEIVLEKHPTSKTKQTVKLPRIPSSVRQRRTLHRPRRYRRRSSTPFRAIGNSNATRRQQQHSNATIHHPMTSNNRRKRSTQKSVSNRMYHQVESPILCVSEEIFAYPLQFHQLLACPPLANEQVLATSENEESIPQEEPANDEQEEELCPHGTFEDFLLRRRPKSSCSTLASVTNTLLSSESLSSEVPPRPPPLPPPITQRSPSGVALSLDKKDVDFIHDIIQRSHGDQRVSNRIAALKEAYVRAANKRNDLLKTQKPSPDKTKSTMKKSVVASKIRDELEKYDELPVHRKPLVKHDEENDYDETYTTNEIYRYHYHRRLPPIPSTTERIINFMVSLKKQLQKNFHEIRSRMLIETMPNARHKHTFHHASGPTRRPRTSHTILPRSSSHYSMDRSYPSHRQQFSRTHSNISQIHPSLLDKHLSHRPRTFRVIPHQQQSQRRR